jgi:hypothetical protein
MKSNYRKFYLLSLLMLILTSAYPIYMGIVTLITYFQKGFVDAKEYPKYIIPYTPLCIAILVAVALMPILFKLCKKYTLLVSSALGSVVFFLSEFGFEKIKVLARL